MWEMLKKDLYHNRKYLLIWLGAAATLCLLFMTIHSEFFRTSVNDLIGIYGPLIIVLFSIPGYATNEAKNGNLGFLRSLPVSPRIVVSSPFIITFSLALASALIAALLARANSTAEPMDGWLQPKYHHVFILATLPIVGMGFVGFFKKGLNLARIYAMTFLLSAGVVLMYMVKKTDFASDPPLPFGGATMIIALSLTIYLLELLLSCRLYAKREIA